MVPTGSDCAAPGAADEFIKLPSGRTAIVFTFRGSIISARPAPAPPSAPGGGGTGTAAAGAVAATCAAGGAISAVAGLDAPASDAGFGTTLLTSTGCSVWLTTPVGAGCGVLSRIEASSPGSVSVAPTAATLTGAVGALMSAISCGAGGVRFDREGRANPGDAGDDDSRRRVQRQPRPGRFDYVRCFGGERRVEPILALLIGIIVRIGEILIFRRQRTAQAGFDRGKIDRRQRSRLMRAGLMRLSLARMGLV